MRSLFRSFLVLAGLLCAVALAMADHMNGSYTGTGNAQGVNLQLKQSGRAVTGQFTGGAQGSLNGQSDGGDNVSGSAELAGAGQFKFEGRWAQQGFNLTLIGSDGRADFFFASAGGGGGGGGASAPGNPGNPGQPQPPASPAPPPPPPAADVQYFLVEGGQTVGPFTLQQVKQRIAEGRTSREDLIWKEGLSGWVAISTLPEFRETPPPPPPPGGGTPPPPPPPGGQKPTPPGGGGVLTSPGFPGRTAN